jgi:hypothetical protein
MCIICIDFDRRRLTSQEARRALGEMAEKLGEAHVQEIEQKLDEADAAAEPPKPTTP